MIEMKLSKCEEYRDACVIEKIACTISICRASRTNRKFESKDKKKRIGNVYDARNVKMIERRF